MEDYLVTLVRFTLTLASKLLYSTSIVFGTSTRFKLVQPIKTDFPIFK